MKTKEKYTFPKTATIFILLFMWVFGMVETMAQVNRLSVPDITVAMGKPVSMPVYLDNVDEIVGIQFMLEVPEGVSVDLSSALLGDRKDDHSVTLRSVENNKYMVMIFSPTNKPIKARTGVLMTMEITPSDLSVNTSYDLSLTDVVLGISNGDNVLTDVSVGKITVSTWADLEVGQVKVSQSSLTPSGQISVNWQVENVGEEPLVNGWSEQIYLDSDDGTSLLLGTLYHDGGLTAKSTITRMADLQLPNTLGMDGHAKVRVKLTPYVDSGEPTGYQKNNEAFSENTLAIAKQLFLSPETSSIEEKQGRFVRYSLMRSGNYEMAETFTIEYTEDGRLEIPATVTIPAGQPGIYFYAQITPNGVWDEESVVEMKVSGNGYPEVGGNLKIEDDTYISLFISSDVQEITEGGSAVLTIGMERVVKEDTEVKLSCDRSSRFNIPSSIMIPAGQLSVNVEVNAVEDDIPDIEQVVTFTVTAAKCNQASKDMVLLDNDVPTLQFEITPSAVSEAAGPLAVSAKLKRVDNIDKKVTIRLSDDSDGGIFYSRQTIEMPVGVEEMIVNLGPVDNAMVDGERTYTISAAVFIASCSCNANNGTSGGLVSAPLTVYDNDGSSLSLSSSVSVLNEGNEMTITVSRNTTTESDLSITLNCDHEDEVEFPLSVVIPSGEKSVSFTVKSKGNDMTGDGFTAILTAEADGFTKSNVWFMVSDQTLPDAQILSFSVSDDEVEVGDTVKVNMTITNMGAYELEELTKVGVYLGNGANPVAIAYLQSPLAIGEKVEISRDIVMPETIGTYNIYAVVNDGLSVKELLYSNNTSNVISVKTVSPFSAEVNVDKSFCQQDESVVIFGKIQGRNVSNRNIEIYVINDGYRHVISAETEEDGTFSIPYKPYSSQMGHFVIGVCYPGEGLREAMASFDVYGFKRVSNSAIICESLLGEPYNESIILVNPGVLSLSDFRVNVLSKPEHCDITFVCPEEVKGGETFKLNYSIVGNEISSGNEWEQINIQIETAEGASLTTVLYYYCRNPKGQLKSSVASVNTTMIKGESRDYIFFITNVGKGETGKITLSLPEWMGSTTPREMPSLAPGDTASVALILRPTEAMQLNVPVTGIIGINCENGIGIPLNYSIESVSEKTGTLIVDVCDEYTYYTAEAPHVADAQVIVKHPITGAVIVSGKTDEKGLYEVSLPEGYYAVSVTADNHDSYNNNILVDPGCETKEVVNLSFRAITVDWNVEETQIEDEYSIVTTVKYETNVPMPVVELSVPSSIAAKELQSGESLLFYATLTNKGLITAQDVELQLPSGFNTLLFEALSYNESPFNLAPQQSVTIPVKVTNITDTLVNAKRRAKPIDDDPCVGQMGTLYSWDCGKDRKWHRYDVALQLGSCKSDDPSTWDNSGNNSYGGGYYVPGVGITVVPHTGPGGSEISIFGSNTKYNSVTIGDTGCEPCQNQFLADLVDCGLQLIPLYRVAKGAIGCVRRVYELIGDFQEEHEATYLAGAVLETASTCLAAKNSLSGSKNPSAAEKRADAISSIVTTVGDLSGKLAQGDEDALGWDNVVETLGSLSQSLATLFGLDFDHLENLFCPLKLLKPCDKEGASSVAYVAPRVNINNSYPSYIQEYQKAVSFILMDEMLIMGIKYKFYDDIAWMDADGEQLNNFLTQFDLLLDEKSLVSDDVVAALIAKRPENVSKEEVHKFISRWNNTILEADNADVIDLKKIVEFMGTLNVVDSVVASMGYSSIEECYESEYKKCLQHLEEVNNSVCSSISLQLSQTMTMTRQAFRGTLTVFNGNEEKAMENVRLNLEVRDEDGLLTTSHEFQVNPEALDGFVGDLNLTSGWSLAADETGKATIMFIPTKYAALETNKDYSFGGTLSYIDPFTGLEVIRELYPVMLTVKPSPNLGLTYFMQRDIIGDDPLTEAIEPCEEAEFSLLINNTGYGDATDVRMVTAQPEIIDNEKGLFVDFELMSSQLNGEDKTLAFGENVATNFGTIPAKSTAYAQWWIKGSLLGHFTDYNIEATHITSYGNPDLSLLDTVLVRELIRSIDVVRNDNKMVGFMTNDFRDAEDTPDMLYLSDGNIEPVGMCISSIIHQSSESNYTLTVVPTDLGWNYGSVKDPTGGRAKLKSVVRQGDRAEISLRNFWQTDRTLRDGKDPLYENRIHFADDFVQQSAETYILEFESIPELVLEVASVENIPEEGTVTFEPVNYVTVIFNKPVNPVTFTADDIAIIVQGVKLDVSLVNISTEDNKTFRLDLSKLNEITGNGYYTLTVQTAEIEDQEGFYGKNGKTVGWIFFRSGKVRLDTSVYPADAGTVTRSVAGTESESNSMEYGTKVTLSAVPSIGYEFSNWSIGGDIVSTASDFEYTAINDVDVVANFILKTYSVTVDTEIEGGMVSDAYTGIYSYGDELTFRGVPNDGFVLENWVVNDELLKADIELKVKVDRNFVISAIFVRDKLNLDETIAPDYEDGFYKSVILKRTLTAGNWSTFIVPFSMDIPEGWKVMELTGATLDTEGYIVLNFTSVESVEAGNPYMICTTDDVTMIEVQNKEVRRAIKNVVVGNEEVGNVTFIGNYTPGYVPLGAYFVSKNAFYHATGTGNTLKGFRGYITIDVPVTAEIKGMRYLIDGDVVTNIDNKEIDENQSVMSIYTTDGCRQTVLQKGLNIVKMSDGTVKKIFIIK